MKNGIELHVINTNKFKTNLVAIFLTTPLTRENVTKNSVLSSVLRRGCQKYKTQEEINKKLEEMYGAEFDCGLDKIGKNQVIKLYIECINDQFVLQNNENLLEQSIELISDIAFNPFIEKEQFNDEYVNQEKENVKQLIEAKKDNKARYALFRCTEEMFKERPEGLYKYGYIEDLQNINANNLYKYYKELLKNCKIDIFISGDLKDLNIDEIINRNENISSLDKREPIYSINRPEKNVTIGKEKNIEEKMDVTQGKLVIGYDIITDEKLLQKDNLRYIGIVYNAILGGSATSKMFQNVREKASLAYTANSNYSYYTNSIFVSAGIEINNYQKALEIIKDQVKAMEEGDFSEEDIQNAKNMLKSNILAIGDEQDTEIIYYLGQVLSNNDINIEQYISYIEDINKNEIIDFAKKVKVNTTYFLKKE